MQPINPITGKQGIPKIGYILVALVAVAAPWIAYGYVERWPRVIPGMPAWEPNAMLAARTESAVQRAVARSPIVDVLLLLAPQHKSTIAGEPVRLTCVEVRTVQFGRGFWTGQAGTPPIFVATPGEIQGLAAGAIVNVEGSAAVPQGSGGQLPALTREQGVYIQARRVDVLDHPVCGGI